MTSRTSVIATPAMTPRPEKRVLRVTIGRAKRIVEIVAGASVSSVAAAIIS